MGDMEPAAEEEIKEEGSFIMTAQGQFCVIDCKDALINFLDRVNFYLVC